MVGVIEISGRDRHTLGEEGTHLPVTWTERSCLPERPRLASHAGSAAASPTGSTNQNQILQPLRYCQEVGDPG